MSVLKFSRHAAIALSLFAGAATAAPMTYVIDPTHTSARYSYNLFGWTTQQHRFDSVKGEITLDQETKTASANIVIDVKSLRTGSSSLDGELLSNSDFFDADRYPTINFVATSAKFDGNKVVSVDGTLTIKGISKPVSLTVTAFHAAKHPRQVKRDALGADAMTTIKRSEFNMGANPSASDELVLSFAVQAFKAP